LTTFPTPLPEGAAIDAARGHYRGFIELTRAGPAEFRLTPRSEASPYALCFAIFGLHLLGDRAAIAASAADWDAALRANLGRVRAERAARAVLARDKSYLQLLTFTLSALHILGTLRDDPLRDEILPLLPADVPRELREAGCLRGDARSGNHAMFLAIFMLHAREFLGVDTSVAIGQWVDSHRQHMNRFGFWGDDATMSHLQFQNGYHQYEILDYLGGHEASFEKAAPHVAALADPLGQFAPYPGGGGCYDYDAVFMLTCADPEPNRPLLARTANTILESQNADGGFGESRFVRPRSASNLWRATRHVLAATGRARVERLRYGLTLLRPKHDRIETHWTRYSREWNESDLWDSWFRMLAVARIQVALGGAPVSAWGFIDYPGIGYY
jgi:hypothetical protein